MLPWERNLAFNNSGDVVALLSLATEVFEDDEGHAAYSFVTPAVSATLRIGYGVDVHIALNIPSQVEPVAQAKLQRCHEYRVANEEPRKHIEFIGHHESTALGQHSRLMAAGFRLTLHPTVSLRLFFDLDEQA